MDRVLQDAKYALRVLLRDRGFATTALLTLAICIGANAAIFAIVNSVLLQPLPVPDAEQLVHMYNAYPGAGLDDAAGATGVPDYYDRLRETDVFQEQALYNTRGVTIGQDGSPQRITAMAGTPSLLRLLQVQPLRGRIFTEEDGEVGADRKVDADLRGAGSSCSAAATTRSGSDLRINGEPYTVVGVLPAGFVFLDPDVKLWLPVAFTAEEKADDRRHSNNWSYVARLKAGATIEQARQQIDALNARNLDRFPALKEILINARFHTVVVPLHALPGARDSPDALPAVGRRRVRAADRRRERHQPDAGAVLRPDEGAGDQARARRRHRPDRASAADRNGRADAGRRRARPAARMSWSPDAAPRFGLEQHAAGHRGRARRTGRGVHVRAGRRRSAC